MPSTKAHSTDTHSNTSTAGASSHNASRHSTSTERSLAVRTPDQAPRTCRAPSRQVRPMARTRCSPRIEMSILCHELGRQDGPCRPCPRADSSFGFIRARRGGVGSWEGQGDAARLPVVRGVAGQHAHQALLRDRRQVGAQTPGARAARAGERASAPESDFLTDPAAAVQAPALEAAQSRRRGGGLLRSGPLLRR